MAKFILLKMDDDAVAKFVEKAGKRAVGVWDCPKICGCPTWVQKQAGSWEYNTTAGRRECIDCGGVHKTVTTLAGRLRMAFLSNNLIKRFR